MIEETIFCLSPLNACKISAASGRVVHHSMVSFNFRQINFSALSVIMCFKSLHDKSVTLTRLSECIRNSVLFFIEKGSSFLNFAPCKPASWDGPILTCEPHV